MQVLTPFTSSPPSQSPPDPDAYCVALGIQITDSGGRRIKRSLHSDGWLSFESFTGEFLCFVLVCFWKTKENEKPAWVSEVREGQGIPIIRGEVTGMLCTTVIPSYPIHHLCKSQCPHASVSS